MTRDEILNMPAGNDMDYLIGEEVLKLDAVTWNHKFFHGRTKYSADISAAWEVIEVMKSKECFLRLTYEDWPSLYFWCSFKYSATAETAPLAICRAALLAVMEVEG